jgi:hypothetical protein
MTQWTGYPSLFRFKNNDQNFQIHLRKTNIHQGQHSATTETRRHSAERIVRKNRDVMQLLSKPATSHVTDVEEDSPKSLTVLDLLLKSLQDKNYCEVLCKKFFKLGETKILVSFWTNKYILISHVSFFLFQDIIFTMQTSLSVLKALLLEEQGTTKVQLATNYAEPLILHWALAQKAGEWKVNLNVLHVRLKTRLTFNIFMDSGSSCRHTASWFNIAWNGMWEFVLWSYIWWLALPGKHIVIAISIVFLWYFISLP